MSAKKTKVFIDGKEGTTGLRITRRLGGRQDLELLSVPEERRKDLEERRRLINSSDITILCLPDAAARESVSLVENQAVRIIDASTAHRTQDGWSYGFPELSPAHRQAIRTGNRIAVPGCHASGFIALAYPLTTAGLVAADYPFVAYSVTGYSGGGKKMIAEYEAPDRSPDLSSPRQYGLSQSHKHLPEMQKIPGLALAPVFSPIVADFYSGMAVTVPLFSHLMKKKVEPEQLWEIFARHYAGQQLVTVAPFGTPEDGFLPAGRLAGKDTMEIIVAGNRERLLLAARFDNLGKGASGAAVQCLNIMTGKEETEGLNR